MTIPLQDSGNLATHYHHDKECFDLLHNHYSDKAASIRHYTTIGSRYCPRVLQQCESIILESLSTSPSKHDLTRYTKTKHPEAV